MSISFNMKIDIIDGIYVYNTPHVN